MIVEYSFGLIGNEIGAKYGVGLRLNGVVGVHTGVKTTTVVGVVGIDGGRGVCEQ